MTATECVSVEFTGSETRFRCLGTVAALGPWAMLALFVSWAEGYAQTPKPTSTLQPLPHSRPALLNEWNGEFFQRGEGGLYGKFRAKGFVDIGSDLRVEAFNILRRKTFTFSLKSVKDAESGGAQAPRQLWKAPTGKYEVRGLSLIDGKGRERTWKPKTRKVFLVKRLKLSNLGLWTVVPSGQAELKVKFSMLPNTYREEGEKSDSSVAAVIDGTTGQVQERFAGRKLFRAAEDNFATRRQIRATVRQTRKIAMFHKLNLFKHNRHAPKISKVLDSFDPELRKCYTDRLEWSENLRGSIRYRFILSKTTKTMAKLKKAGGTVKDEKLVECVLLTLAAISFPISRSMLGEVEYIFDIR